MPEKMNPSLEYWSVPQRAMLSRILKAMAHPTRLAIIDMLAHGQRLSVTEIHTRLGADQSSVSHHLGIMRDRGVLSCERQGKQVLYFLKNPAIQGLLSCFSSPASLN
jgi:DNA-binding transcriptional ArsR family regulator